MSYTKNILAFAITTAIFASSAQAAFTNPGNWTRGDINSVYAEWDVFNAVYDDSPDIGSANLASGYVTGTDISKTSSGNLYSSFSPSAVFNISITGNESGPVLGSLATAYLQIGKGAGSTDLDISSVTLNGLAATSSVLDGSNYLFSWNTTGVENWAFTFNTGSHFSLATMSVDIATSQVPVPAAAWLMGSGLAGLASIARRRKA
jgi:hypothetical protein